MSPERMADEAEARAVEEAKAAKAAKERAEIQVRPTRLEDFDPLIGMCRDVYPDVLPWGREQLASHLRVFPEGQLVAVEKGTGRVLGMASSLVIRWDDYDLEANWRDFTDHGMFTNHDPTGKTLYGAEVMVSPYAQGRGVGSALYRARRELVRRLGLKRIRAGARLRGYHKVAGRMSAEEYVDRVVAGELYDATLSFQLNRGFEVLGVVQDYLHSDPESLGWAALIEWLNPHPERANHSNHSGRKI